MDSSLRCSKVGRTPMLEIEFQRHGRSSRSDVRVMYTPWQEEFRRPWLGSDVGTFA